MKIVFTGGGTAGHIFPLIAIIDELQSLTKQDPTNLKLFYLGPKDKKTADLFKDRGVRVKNITAGKVRRYFSIKNFFDIFKLPWGFFQAINWCFWRNPDIIFSKGGFGSFPTALAALFLRIPLFLHESDSRAGLAAKIQSKWALEVFTSFEKTNGINPKKIISVGNPVRKAITAPTTHEEAKIILRLVDEKPLVLFLGGSQGAVALNNIILDILPDLLSDFEIIHQTGRANFKQIKKETDIFLSKEQKRGYHPFGFLNEKELKNSLDAAVLVISRAGAGAIFEIASAGKPAILTPLPLAAQNHQVSNGYLFKKAGAGEVIEQDNLKPHFILEKIRYLIKQRPDLLAEMGQNSLNFSRPKASWLIATYLLEYLNPKKD